LTTCLAHRRWHQAHIHIIDVSQSVESDHPRAYDFLRTDIRNVKDFFARQGIPNMLSLRRMWDFIVDPALPDHEAELLDHIRDREPSDDLDDDAVFMSSYIPRSLAEVYDPERDVEVVKAGKGDQLIYAGIAGLKQDVTDGDALAEPLASVRLDAPLDDASASASSEDDRPRGFRHEDKDAKKVSPPSHARSRPGAEKSRQRRAARTSQAKDEQVGKAAVDQKV
jgi:RIO kinase 1